MVDISEISTVEFFHCEYFKVLKTTPCTIWLQVHVHVLVVFGCLCALIIFYLLVLLPQFADIFRSASSSLRMCSAMTSV